MAVALKISKAEALLHLNNLAEASDKIFVPDFFETTSNLTVWLRRVRVVLENIFGYGSTQVSEFFEINFGAYRRQTFSKTDRAEISDSITIALIEAQGLIKGLFHEVKEFGVSQSDMLQASEAADKNIGTNNVFIVHGRDDGAKDAVARLVSRLGFNPVILHEKPKCRQNNHREI